MVPLSTDDVPYHEGDIYGFVWGGNRKFLFRDLASTCGDIGEFKLVEDVSSDEAGFAYCAVTEKDYLFF